MKIGVMGMGVVGGTLYDALRERTKHDVRGYDPYKTGFSDLTALEGCDVVFVCVWTPNDGDKLDETAVWDAVAEAGDDPIIVVRSTVMPGTMTELDTTFSNEFCFVPEFLIEAAPMESMLDADRTVVGRAEKGSEAGLVVAQLMIQVVPRATVFFAGLEEAVLIKLGSNAMLAAKVALANEIAIIADAYGADYSQVQTGMGLDTRIGHSHLALNGRGGYGGSCFPKDVRGLVHAAGDAGVSPEILLAVETANEGRYK